MLPNITAIEAEGLLRQGATLVDVREPDERARLRIPGSIAMPISRPGDLPGEGPLVFHCASGARTRANAALLEAQARGRPAWLLEGGLTAWQAAGLPVEEDRSAPLPIMRQVQIVAGALVMLGVALALLVHPGFIALAGLVGAGLVFAGVSGFCGMAVLLGRMPWNRA